MKRALTSFLLLILYLSVYAQVKPFCFAQLTDIHINGDSPSQLDALKNSVQQINSTENVDFVIVTGDLTDNGDMESMLNVKRCLNRLRMPYYVCMGNHETTWSASGCMAYGRIFGKEHYSLDKNGVRFLFFNSGPLLKMALGHVSPGVISWAKRKIQEAKEHSMPVIAVTHYPMKEGDVDNWYEVTDAFRETGNLKLFIGGHYHRLRNWDYDGIPGILMRSNLPDKEGRSGYGLYEVTPDSIRAFLHNYGEEKQFLGAFSLKSIPYLASGKAEKYPDYSDNVRFPDVKELWVKQTGGAIYGSPAVEKNRVFIGDDDGFVKAFNLKNGKELWSFHTEHRVIGGPAVQKGIVVVGSADKFIYGLDAKCGRLLWKVPASQPVLGAVSIDKGIAFVGSGDSVFRAIDIKTGHIVWKYQTVPGYVMTKPLVTEDKVIFGAWDNTLYCLDKRDGKELWKWTNGLKDMHYSPAQVWPVSSNDRVFIVDPKRAMTAIDINTGKTIWRTFQSKVRESIGLSEDGKRIYAKTMQDSVVCYDALSDVPRQIWATDVQFGYEHGPCMLPEKDGIVYGSTKEGLTFALEGLTGKLLWRHKNGNSLMNTVVPSGRKQLLFTSTSGELGLLKFE